jgi:DNA-binding NarL/FixJ family response regulator
MKTPPTITVGIVEDEEEVRLGLSYILNNTEGFTCTDAFESFNQALRSITTPPAVLLSDIGLPGIPGVEGVRLFKERFPTTAIIMLTVYSDDDKIFRSICNGASGYVLKKESPARILEAIRDVYDGGSPMSSEIASRVLAAFRALLPKRSSEHLLSPREEEILQELVRGNSYKSTADHLFISIHTVRFHIRSIYEKLQVHSKSEAVAKALRDGLA